MFTLNCPECGHKTRVRYAKLGVTAGCPACDAKFKLSEQNMESDPETLQKSVAATDVRNGDSQLPAAHSQIRPVNWKPTPAADKKSRRSKKSSRPLKEASIDSTILRALGPGDEDLGKNKTAEQLPHMQLRKRSWFGRIFGL